MYMTSPPPNYPTIDADIRVSPSITTDPMFPLMVHFSVATTIENAYYAKTTFKNVTTVLSTYGAIFLVTFLFIGWLIKPFETF